MLARYSNNNENTVFYCLTRFNKIHQLRCKDMTVITEIQKALESLIASNLLFLSIITKLQS